MGKIKTCLICVCFILYWHNSFGQVAINQQRLIETAQSQIGVREATGKNDGPEIKMYLATTGLPEGHPWCAAFVNWVHVVCDITTVKSAAWSPSWFPSQKVIYDRAAKSNPIIPQPGDVFGLYYQNLGRIGHVGFVEQWGEGDFYITIEGNTNDALSREGDGVYRKRRLKRQVFKISRFYD